MTSSYIQFLSGLEICLSLLRKYVHVSQFHNHKTPRTYVTYLHFHYFALSSGKHARLEWLLG
jgi:hypothetical protein